MNSKKMKKKKRKEEMKKDEEGGGKSGTTAHPDTYHNHKHVPVDRTETDKLLYLLPVLLPKPPEA